MLDLKRFSIDYPKPKYVLSERKEKHLKEPIKSHKLSKAKPKQCFDSELRISLYTH